MARIIMAAVLAALIAFSAAAMAQQGSRASRWQPDQFGPIVPTDTMWSIATYYGRQRGVSLFEMMDAIVAANPRAFRDNRPDFMLTGFYLEIPELGEQVAAETTPKASVPESKTATAAETSETETETAAETAAQTDETAVASTEVEGEIAISVSEMQALRGQLSESINLIESLQTENTDLQDRLAAVNRELRVLRQLAAEEQRASAEMETMAQELNTEGTEELTAGNVEQQPTASNPAMDSDAAENAQAEAEQADSTQAESTTESQDTAEAAAASPADDTAALPVAEAAEPQPVETRSRSQQQNWLDWLLKPLHLGLIALLLILVLGGLWYFAYVRRLEREMAMEPEPEVTTDPTPETRPDTGPETRAGVDTIEDTELAASASMEIAETEATEAARISESDKDLSDELAERTEAESSEWQEQPDEPMTTAAEDVEDVEVTDVDLDAYLRDQSEASEGAQLEESDYEGDSLSKEVDALLSFEPSTEEDDKPVAPFEPEDVSEYRIVETPEDEVPDADSFGGLRLDDEMTTSPAKDKTPAVETEESDVEATDATDELETEESKSSAAESVETAKDDDDYLSIESLMEEADTEASEEQVDPYDKDKINDALAGDDTQEFDYDLSTEAMLDESKSPAARLDLAQVYIDMGEVDDARELLESIQGCDDEEAEQEATALLKKLSEQGGR